jgi:hypothetical protein
MQSILPPDTQVLEVLENKLSTLAAQWRGASRRGETELAQAIVQQYHAVLLCMIELGHHEFLDAETELPDRLMPPEYFQWVEQLNADNQLTS